MKFIIFFIFIPLISSELHTFMTAYTSQTFPGTPEFVAVSSLDGHQIHYYNSNTMRLIHKQDWLKELAKEPWKKYIEITEKQQQICKNNINSVERFSQSAGVHTYQRRYGCEWDDVTKESQGFDEYGYDGEDFISLNLTESRYTPSVSQAKPTAQKWNNDQKQLEILQKYFEQDCVYWLKELLHLSKAAFKKTDLPKVSLLQKNPENEVECHVTGFLFRNTTVLWRENGQAMSDSVKLEIGETLPNEDGTFQRSLTLYVHPNKWKKSQYACVVEHQSLTETVQKILTVNEIKSNKPGSDASSRMYLGFYLSIISVVVVLIGLCVYWKHRKDFKVCNKHSKLKPEPTPPHTPPISTSSKKKVSSSEVCES